MNGSGESRGPSSRRNPLDNLPGNFETLGATLENAARLAKAGVTIAFMTGDAHNGRNLKQAASDPLELTTFADAVFIRGREIPMTSRQTELRDRYKDLNKPLPPAYQKP